MVSSKNELMNGVGDTGRLDKVMGKYLPGMREEYFSAMRGVGEKQEDCVM